MIYTTPLQVSQIIKEILGEIETEFYHVIKPDGVHVTVHKSELTSGDKDCPALTLSELSEALKDIGEKLEWTWYCRACDHDMSYCGCDTPDAHVEGWIYHYFKVCELKARGQDADYYLLRLLK